MGSQMDQVREALERERRRLRTVKGSLVTSNANPAEATELSPGSDQHPADTGTELFERERDLSILEDVNRELEEVEAARRRLEDGTYGRCEDCQQEIPPERLEAIPTARRCAADQAKMESASR
jgi:RNA polymerase-binding transcription factor DksA